LSLSSSWSDSLLVLLCSQLPKLVKFQLQHRIILFWWLALPIDLYLRRRFWTSVEPCRFTKRRFSTTQPMTMGWQVSSRKLLSHPKCFFFCTIITSILKSLVIVSIWLAVNGAIYSWIAPFFCSKSQFFQANRNGLLKQNKYSDFKANQSGGKHRTTNRLLVYKFELPLFCIQKCEI